MKSAGTMFLTTCAVALVLAYLPQPANAQDAPKIKTIEGEVTGDSVAIRSDHTQTANRIALAYKGDKVQVIREQDGWYQIELPSDYVMWIAKQYVAAGTGKEGVVTGTNVRCRDGGGVQYQATGRLNPGRRIELLDEKDEWYKFRFAKGEKGYIASAFVKVPDDSGLAPPRNRDDDVGVKPPDPDPEDGDNTIHPPVDPNDPQPKIEAEAKRTFERAEGIWRIEIHKELADQEFTTTERLYERVMEMSRNDDIVSESRRRLSTIKALRILRDSRKVKPKENHEKKIAQIDREFEEKRRKLRERLHNLFPTCVAVGYVRKLESVWLRPNTHKLVKDGKMVRCLYSRTVDLKMYEGEFVGIEGTVDSTLKWPIPSIKVTGVILKKVKPETVGEKPDKDAPAEEPVDEKPAKVAPAEEPVDEKKPADDDAKPEEDKAEDDKPDETVSEEEGVAK